MLPPADGTVVVEARVDERGCVTSVCIVRGLGDAFDRAMAEFVKAGWYFRPASLGGRDVPTVVTLPVNVTRHPQRLTGPIAQSTDVAWLASIAADEAGIAEQMGQNGLLNRHPKDMRTAAFARLGELGTKQSLAAVRDIEARARTIVPAPDRIGLGRAPAAGWHMGDGQTRLLGETRSPDGIVYGVVAANLVGGYGLFLTSRDPADASKWMRPRPIPVALFRGATSFTLSWKGGGELTLSFVQGQPPPRGIMEATPNPGPPPPSTGPQKVDIVIADVLRDSDGDLWTDIEEARLGLDPKNPDTDGDGVPDGRDVCPNYAPTADDRNDESVQIIQKAVFAAFGLTGSRESLFPRAESRKVQLWGYQAPIIYGHPPPKAGMRSSPDDTPQGLVFVGWTIGRKSATDAVVTLTDWEGNLAGGGQEVYLEKKDGEWFVVARFTTWVS